MKHLLLLLAFTSGLANAQLSDIDSWNAPINSDEYFEAQSKLVTVGSGSYKISCKAHQPTQISSEQPSAECAILKADNSVLIAKLTMPYVHDVYGIASSESGSITIEASSDKCDYKLTYSLVDIATLDSNEELGYTDRTEDCWR